MCRGLLGRKESKARHDNYIFMVLLMLKLNVHGIMKLRKPGDQHVVTHGFASYPHE